MRVPPISSSGLLSSLAIHGGLPASARFLPFGAPCLGQEEIAAVVSTLQTGWIGTGPVTAQFEAEFAQYVGTRHAVAVNSCTSGLFLSLLALGIGPGDEVVTTPLTFAATANVIEHVGARPVFADVDPHTLTIDPDSAARAVTSRTRALLAVHFGGRACDAGALAALGDRHGFAIIEDAAHAVGTRYERRMAGSLGRVASFSFYANKNLTTAEGGMVTTDDESIVDQLTTLRVHGLTQDAWHRCSARALAKYEVVAAGYKCNLPDLLAAIGLEQLRKQEHFLSVRELYASKYDQFVDGLPARHQPRPADLECNRHSLHLYVVTLDPGRWSRSRDEIVAALLAENVGVAVHYRALHVEPYYRRKYGYSPNDYPNAWRVGENSFSLPITPAMSEADIESVIYAMRKVATAYVL